MRRSRPQSGRVHWSALVFLILFTIVVLVVAFYAIKPGAARAQTASDSVKRQLAAWYRLLLFVILFVLFCGVLLCLRIGRFFFPRATPKRTETKYVDAWAESAKRVEVPPAEKDDGDEDDRERDAPT